MEDPERTNRLRKNISIANLSFLLSFLLSFFLSFFVSFLLSFFLSFFLSLFLLSFFLCFFFLSFVLSFFLSFFPVFPLDILLPNHCRCIDFCCTGSHSKTHSLKLLWTKDQPVVKTSTWQLTTFTRNRKPCHRRNSNPKSQQANSCKLPRHRSHGHRNRVNKSVVTNMATMRDFDKFN